MLQYFRYLWQSTNQHGVHSPYVYNFLTKGLYATKFKYQSVNPKAYKIALATIAYFNFKKVYCEDQQLTKLLLLHYPDMQLNNSSETYDCIFVSISDPNKFASKMHNNSLLFHLNKIDNITKLTANFKLVLHFYCCQIVSNRKEQKKQLFVLRY